MLKQSVKNELRSPILWHDEYYDFGDFDTAINRHSKENVIYIRLKSPFPVIRENCHSERCFDCYLANRDYNIFIGKSNSFDVEIGISKNKNCTILKSIELFFDDYRIKIVSEDDNNDVYINDTLFDKGNTAFKYKSKGLLPILEINLEFEKADSIIIKSLEEADDDVEESINKLFAIRSIEKEEIVAYWNQNRMQSNFLSTLLVELSKDEKSLNEIIQFVILRNVASCVKIIDRYLSEFFVDSSYIAPLRVMNGRYMLNSERAIEEIDSTGKNIMEVILNMDRDERKSYKKFLKDTLNVTIDVKGNNNKSIVVTNDNRESYNIVDEGAGYSQLLPIATLLWKIITSEEKICSIPYTITIEQPEIHLHPAMQTAFVNMIYRTLQSAQKKKKRLHILIETHSPTIVNRIGRLVRDTSKIALRPEDVSVYLFSKLGENTSIVSTRYNENGMIEKWPIGFLD